MEPGPQDEEVIEQKEEDYSWMNSCPWVDQIELKKMDKEIEKLTAHRDKCVYDYGDLIYGNDNSPDRKSLLDELSKIEHPLMPGAFLNCYAELGIDNPNSPITDIEDIIGEDPKDPSDKPEHDIENEMEPGIEKAINLTKKLGNMTTPPKKEDKELDIENNGIIIVTATPEANEGKHDEKYNDKNLIKKYCQLMMTKRMAKVLSDEKQLYNMESFKQANCRGMYSAAVHVLTNRLPEIGTLIGTAEGGPIGGVVGEAAGEVSKELLNTLYFSINNVANGNKALLTLHKNKYRDIVSCQTYQDELKECNEDDVSNLGPQTNAFSVPNGVLGSQCRVDTISILHQDNEQMANNLLKSINNNEALILGKKLRLERPYRELLSSIDLEITTNKLYGSSPEDTKKDFQRLSYFCSSSFEVASYGSDGWWIEKCFNLFNHCYFNGAAKKNDFKTSGKDLLREKPEKAKEVKCSYLQDTLFIGQGSKNKNDQSILCPNGKEVDLFKVFEKK